MNIWQIPKIRQQVETARDRLLNAMTSAFVLQFGEGKLVKQEPVTEFDYECRWWVVPSNADIPSNVEVVKNVDRSLVQPEATIYYSIMTSLPVDRAMVSLTINGHEMELMFAPRVIQRTRDKPRGFG